MFFEQDMTIPKKFINVANFQIYDTNMDRYGVISEINLYPGFNEMLVVYYAYFDCVNNHNLIFYNDFVEGKLKFVMLSDDRYQKMPFMKLREREIGTIMEFLGDAYTENSIIWVADRDRKDKLSEQEYREKQKIGEVISWAESATVDEIFESYSAQKLFCLYGDRVITKEQMMRELINILAAEKRTERDMNLKVGTDNFVSDMRKVIEENKDLFKSLLN